MAKCECAQTLTHHVSKVQSVLWNPAEANVLATGGFDHRAYVLDMRDPEHNQLRWEVTGEEPRRCGDDFGRTVRFAGQL